MADKSTALEQQSIPLNSVPTAEPVPSPRLTSRKSKPIATMAVVKLVIVALLILLVALLIATIVIVKKSCAHNRSSGNSSNSDKEASGSPLKPLRTNPYWQNYRLPYSLKPVHYDVQLEILLSKINLSNSSQASYFQGHVIIDINVVEETDKIIFHQDDLNVTTLSIFLKISNQSSTNITDRIRATSYDEIYHFNILVLSKSLQKGQRVQLKISYQGQINEAKENGLIRTSYNNAGRRFAVVYSKFEPVGARRMLPCLDEPDRKALFSVVIIHETNAAVSVLSNMPVESSVPLGASMTKTRFQRTQVPMSTYLLAVALLTEYENVTSRIGGKRLVRVWASRGRANSAKIPLRFAVQCEKLLADQLGLRSPLPKTDHVYVPNFPAGAMENWGLVTYRDWHLLIPAHLSTKKAKSRLMTVAHELAHIWFGNWITTPWWSELWINEAFATFYASIAYYRLSNLSLQVQADLMSYEIRRVLDSDIGSKSVPVILNVTRPKELIETFNTFTYKKGQYLLTWLESMMGTSSFHSAIRKYLQIYARKNPSTIQFFQIIDEYGPKNPLLQMPTFQDFFQPWLYETNYPVVKVHYDIANSRIILTQTSINQNSSHTRKWPIHITYRISASQIHKEVFFNDSLTIPYDIKPNDFIIFNSDGKAYVRVEYSNYLWTKILEFWSRNPVDTIDARSRSVLIDDYFYFVNSYKCNLTFMRQILDTLDDNFSVTNWLSFYKNIFDKMHNLFREDVEFLKWREFVIRVSARALDNALNLTIAADQSRLDTDTFQSLLIMLNCEVDNPVTVRWISRQFLTWIANPHAIRLPPHLTEIVLYYGIKYNDRYELWMKLWNMTLNSSSPSISRFQLKIGLAGTAKPYLIETLLELYLRPLTHLSDTNKLYEFNELMSWLIGSVPGYNVVQRWLPRNQGRVKRFAFGDNMDKDMVEKYYVRLVSMLSKYSYELASFMPVALGSRIRPIMFAGHIDSNNRWRQMIGKKILTLI